MELIRYFLFTIPILLLLSTGALAYTTTSPSDDYVLGNDLVDQGKYEEALNAFQRARAQDERFYNEYVGISYQIGWLLNKLGRYEEALSEFEKAEEIHPSWIYDFAIYYNKGTLLSKLGRNKEALQNFDLALVRGYDNPYIWYNKGCVLAKMERYMEARDAFENSRSSFMLGTYQDAANSYDEVKGIGHKVPSTSTGQQSAVPAVLSPLAVDRDTSIDLLMNQAIDYLRRNQPDEAIRIDDMILFRDSGHFPAMLHKGQALAELGRYEDADEMLDQAISYLDYHLHESLYTDAWNTKGYVQAKLGKYEDAIDSFDKALMVNPDLFWIHYNKAWVLAKQGKYSEAVEEYDRSLDWENQIRLEMKSASILGPLCSYSDAADAMHKATLPTIKTEDSLSSKDEVLIYRTDFSSDPQWQSSRPKQYFWDPQKKMYHFVSDENLGYAEIPVQYNGSSFRFEYDITIQHADPGSLVRVGLSQYNKTYNSRNAIVTEFKSWRAGQYNNLKDGDKTYQILAIDNNKHATSEEYEGFCYINPEISKAVPSFGENRTYHVSVNYNRDKNILYTIVTDGLHKKIYPNCVALYNSLGLFRYMDRIILVAEEGPNAYIEGYIDNIQIYAVDTSPAQMQTDSPFYLSAEEDAPSHSAVSAPAVSTDDAFSQPSDESNYYESVGFSGAVSGILHNPVFLVLVIFIAGVGIGMRIMQRQSKK